MLVAMVTECERTIKELFTRETYEQDSTKHRKTVISVVVETQLYFCS